MMRSSARREGERDDQRDAASSPALPHSGSAGRRGGRAPRGWRCRQWPSWPDTRLALPRTPRRAHRAPGSVQRRVRSMVGDERACAQRRSVLREACRSRHPLTDRLTLPRHALLRRCCAASRRARRRSGHHCAGHVADAGAHPRGRRRLCAGACRRRRGPLGALLDRLARPAGMVLAGQRRALGASFGEGERA